MAAGEECDDFESWEEMEDPGVLDKKIEKLKAAMSTSIQKDLRNNSSGKSDTVVFLAEDGRTRYVPPEPTVKILKRPSVVNNSHNAGGDGFIVNGDTSGKPKQPIKTLQQREMEYAEARLRILGEAQSPDERPALLERIRRIQNKMESLPEPFEQNVSSPTINSTIMTTAGSSTVINSVPMILTSTQSQINITNSSSAVGGCAGGGGISVIANYGGATGHYSNNINNQSQPQNIAGYSLLNHHHYSNHYIHHNHYLHVNNSTSLSQNAPSSSPATGTTAITTFSPNNIIISSPISYNLVIRQPKGPDGSKGFHLRTLR